MRPSQWTTDGLAMTELSITGYLVLGIVADRDRSAYEIVEQVGKGVAEVWRRADRQLYETPKRLVELGLITARKETSAGRRQRTVYSITPAGRAALTEWIGTAVQPSTMEFEGLVRVLFADQGSTADLAATLQAIAAQARQRRELFVDHARFATDSDGQSFPDRVHLLAIANRYMVSHFTLMIEWAEWACEEIEHWPDTQTPASTRRDRSYQIFRENTRIVPRRKRRS